MIKSVENPPGKPKIDLWSLGQFAGLIIPHPSGVLYSNQAGGLLCRHPEQEGIFVPFQIHPPLGETTFGEALEHQQWRGEFEVSKETADFLDDFFQHYPFLVELNLRVDRQKMKDSLEAWVWVTFQGDFKSLITGFDTNKAILTWRNSD